MKSSSHVIANAVNPPAHDFKKLQFIFALIFLISPPSRERFHNVLHVLRLRKANLASIMEARQLKEKTLSLLRLSNNLKWIALLLMLTSYYTGKPSKKTGRLHTVALVGASYLASYSLFRCNQNPRLTNDSEIVAAREDNRISR
jgi:hypothetical protein